VSFTKIPLLAARWFLLANIVLAAWLYGGTRDWTREWVTWLLLANTVLFLVGVAAQRRFPRVPLVAMIAIVFLIVQGGFMAWNARRQFLEGAGVFVDRIQPMPGWPGFWDVVMVMPSLWLVAGLLGAFCIACDMAAEREWRERFWVTVAGTGLSIVVLGLAQSLTGAEDIFWGLETRRGPTFFGVYRYHANAGAFINLVLPFQVALAVRAFQREGSEAGRVFWTLAAMVTAAAGFVNVSKAANAICLLLLAAMAVWFATSRLRARGARNWLIALVSMLLVAGVAASFGLEKTFSRWNAETSGRGSVSSEGRIEAYRIIIRGALPEAGWWGFGPGTFEKVFDIHRSALGSPLAGRWDKAHSDALQTMMEWGLAGAAAWLVLLAGGFWKSFLAARSDSNCAPVAAGCAFALGGVMLHALVDFPLQISSLQLISILLAGLSWGFDRNAPRVLRNSRLRL
jgi:hypothetical protein